MSHVRPRKIHIIGSVASGKTTLAKKLSHRFNIPYHELDNVVWMRSEHGDIRRAAEARDQCLQELVRQDAWIIEGAHHKEWILPSLKEADLIILLDTAYSKRIFRITKRFLKQKIGLEKAHYQPSLKIFRQMF